MVHNLSQLSASPIKGQGANQNQSSALQQARQSKNSSALGIIGGSIVSNNGGPTGGPPNADNGSDAGVGGQGGQNPFNMSRSTLNKGGQMMYNTMYGGIGAVGNVPPHGPSTTQNAPAQAGAKSNTNPIHIKIED